MTQDILTIGIISFMSLSILLGFSLIAYYIYKIKSNIKRAQIIATSDNVIDFCEYKRVKRKKLA
jgi:hypothetical protein